MSRSRVLAAFAAAFLFAGCRPQVAPVRYESPSDRPPLRRPKKRQLARDDEARLMNLMEDLRCNDYLKRLKAKEDIEGLAAGDPTSVGPYLVQLLDEPYLDVRIEVIRILVDHCRESPEAVETLVEVLNDPNMSVAVRADVAATLRRWTGRDYGYRPWTDPEGAEDAGKRWTEWFEETQGYNLTLPPGL